jgi:hypothetical protein
MHLFGEIMHLMEQNTLVLTKPWKIIDIKLRGKRFVTDYIKSNGNFRTQTLDTVVFVS